MIGVITLQFERVLRAVKFLCRNMMMVHMGTMPNFLNAELFLKTSLLLQALLGFGMWYID